MNFEARRTIPAHHPSLPGHFPGAPIVPAVVILDEVFAALNEWRGDAGLVGIPLAKFLAPLKPKQTFTIRLSPSDDAPNEIDFDCRIEEAVIAQGRFRISAASS